MIPQDAGRNGAQARASSPGDDLRYAHLARLALGLASLGVASTLALKPTEPPALFAIGPTHRRLGVMVAHHPGSGTWAYAWGGQEADCREPEAAARQIVAQVTP